MDAVVAADSATDEAAADSAAAETEEALVAAVTETDTRFREQIPFLVFLYSVYFVLSRNSLTLFL